MLEAFLPCGAIFQDKYPSRGAGFLQNVAPFSKDNIHRGVQAFFDPLSPTENSKT